MVKNILWSMIKGFFKGIHSVLSSRRSMSILTVLLGIIVLSLLYLREGQGQLSSTYFNLYAWFGIFSVLHGIVAFMVDYGLKRSNPDSELARALYLFEEHNSRFRNKVSVYIPLAIMIVLSVVLFLSIAGSSFSLFSLPNPYNFGVQLSAQTLSEHSFGSNLLYGSIIPGLFEEWMVFAGCQALIYFLLLFFHLNGKTQVYARSGFLYWPTTIVVTAVACYAYLFSTAHGRYEGNAPVLIWAFFFEFMVQMINHMTGTFLSWIPHMIHNASVIANDTLSFTVSGVVIQWKGLFKREEK